MTIRCERLDARLIELAGDLTQVRQIARAAGVAESTLHEWLREDPDFARRFYMPLENNRAKVNRGVWTRAMAGESKDVRIVNGWRSLEDASGRSNRIIPELAAALRQDLDDPVERDWSRQAVARMEEGMDVLADGDDAEVSTDGGM